MSWVKVPVTGGVVRSRNGSALAAGEYVTASNCRLKPGDTEQVHNDVGMATFATTSNTVVAGPFYLSFEGSTDKILVVTTDGSANSYLETATVGTSGTFASIQTISGVVTKAYAVHRGDQYFVGTDQGNYVVQDNVSRSMGMDYDSTPLAMGATFSGSGSEVVENTTLSYFLTEYDSTNDIESEIILYDSVTAAAGDAGKDVALDWSGTYTQVNSNADKVRVYRHYYGSDADSLWGAARDAQQRVQIAGLRVEQDIADETYTDQLSFLLDTTPQYPLVSTDVVYGGSIYPFLTKPRSFDLGCVFNDCLVVNDTATSKQVIRWSPPGYPEYQPDPYFMYFATDKSDEVVGLQVVNDRLVVLTTGSVHRVNYLPLAGDIRGDVGRVQELITGRAGCLSRHSHCKFESEQGEFVVWVSGRGLEWSNGVGWSDACPDFVGSLLSTSAPVLVNNEALYRIELYDGTTRWDFYYHPSHIKNGKLKLMGPTTVAQTVAKGACHDADYVWLGYSGGVLVENSGNNATATVLTTGHVYNVDNPWQDTVCEALGVTHSATSGSSYSARVYGKLDGETEENTGPCAIPNGSLEETGRADLMMRGKYLRGELTISGGGAWSAGPMYLDLSLEGGGNGA